MPNALVPISVVVITKNEEDHLPTCLSSVHQWADEIIVVDGGSHDETASLVNETDSNVCLIHSESKGRAMQMNAGASVATGNVLLFTHADMRLPMTCVEDISKVVQSGGRSE